MNQSAKGEGSNVRLLINRLRQNITLFKGLSFEDICFFLEYGEKVSFSQGDVMLQSKATGSHFFILLQGSVEVFVESSSATVIRGSGNILGEIAALLNIKRTAQVKCQTDCVALRYHARILEFVEGQRPKLALKFYKNLVSAMVERYVIEERR